MLVFSKMMVVMNHGEIIIVIFLSIILNKQLKNTKIYQFSSHAHHPPASKQQFSDIDTRTIAIYSLISRSSLNAFYLGKRIKAAEKNKRKSQRAKKRRRSREDGG